MRAAHGHCETTAEDSDRERILALVDELRADPGTVRDAGAFAAAFGVGAPKLRELVRRHFHTTPAALLSRLRVERCRVELLGGDSPTSEVGLAAGFATPRAFDQSFRRATGMTPSAYRALRDAATFSMSLPGDFLEQRALRYLGRDPVSLNEGVEERCFALATRLGGKPASVVTELGRGKARCRIEKEGRLAPGDAAEAHHKVRRMLGLAIDPKVFERRAALTPDIERLIAGRRGMRVPQTQDTWDGLIWVIAGQQVSLPVAFALRRRLSRRYGQPLPGGRLATRPEPERVADLSVADLRPLGWSQRKAEYLTAIARAVADGSLDLEALARETAGQIEERLLALRGFGPWSVNYLMMRAFTLADCVPIGDVALLRALVGFHGLEARPDAEGTQALMRPFAPHRSLATFHFWASLEKSS